MYPRRNNMKTYPCPLDETVTVLETPFGPEAESLAFLLNVSGEGVIILNANVREEPWFTEAHASAIFAHELGHLACGVPEVDAENWAIKRLRELGLPDAVELLLDRGIV
jgi:hypothetical protein